MLSNFNERLIYFVFICFQRDNIYSKHASLSSSVSLNNLVSHRGPQNTDDEECTVFREGPIATKSTPQNQIKTQSYNTIVHKPHLRSSRSTDNIHLPGSSHKIALVTSADPHVNNIVVSEQPKDEKDAVQRLDQLSLSSPRDHPNKLQQVKYVFLTVVFKPNLNFKKNTVE